MISVKIFICSLSLWACGNQNFKILPRNDNVYISILVNIPPPSSEWWMSIISVWELVFVQVMNSCRALGTEKPMLHVLDPRSGGHCSQCWSVPCCASTSKALPNAFLYAEKCFIWGVDVASAGCFCLWCTYWNSK